MRKICILLLFFVISVTHMWSASVSDMVYDFRWLEPNNTVEIAVGESYQLKFDCSSNKNKVFTSAYANNWNHYDFSPFQHIVSTPEGYSIDDNGVVTGLKTGSYAIKFTGLIQPATGVDKMLMINVVSEKKEKESNNTLNTANEVNGKIRFGLSNLSDTDYFKFKHGKPYNSIIYFKVHYIGTRSNFLGYKWATYTNDMTQTNGGSIVGQDQECKAFARGEYVYFQLYFDQSKSQYFTYGDEFTVEILSDSDDDTDGNDPVVEQCAKPTISYENGVISFSCTTPGVTFKSSVSSEDAKDYIGSEYSLLGSYTISVFATKDGMKDSEKATKTITIQSEPAILPSCDVNGDGKVTAADVTMVVNEVLISQQPVKVVPEYVDLGLPSGLLWATFNLGASSIYDKGDFYQWGALTPSTSENVEQKVYCNSGKDISGTEYDAARQAWGGKWRMPTMAECQELNEYTTRQNLTIEGVTYLKVTGRNGNSIIIPSVGYLQATGANKTATGFWTSTPNGSNYAFRQYEWSYVSYSERYLAFPIRPVMEP